MLIHASSTNHRIRKIVKTNGRAIFVARVIDIVLFDVNNYKVSSKIQLPSGWVSRGIYIAGDKLFAILSGSIDNERRGTSIYVFDVKDLYNPILVDKHLIDG